MNDSGRSVGPARGSYKLDLDRVLVIHDEIDLPFGDIRVTAWAAGSPATTGSSRCKRELGSPDFQRVRVGVGRPDTTDPDVVSGHVLGSWRQPADEVRELVDRARRRGRARGRPGDLSRAEPFARDANVGASAQLGSPRMSTEAATPAPAMPRLLAVAACGAAVAIALGIYGRVHDPSQQLVFTLFFSSTIAMKVWLGDGAPPRFALVQVLLALGSTAGSPWAAPGAGSARAPDLAAGSRSSSRCRWPTTACGRWASRTPTRACSRTRCSAAPSTARSRRRSRSSARRRCRASRSRSRAG